MAANFEPHRVLCALDLSEPVDELLETAMSIARRYDAELHLLHVWNPWITVTPDGGFMPTDVDLDTVSQALSVQLGDLATAARRTHVPIETALVPGTPWKQIVLYAETNDCDLILAGTHGRTGFARLVAGSVAERVVRESSIPVLVVPTSKQAALVQTSSRSATEVEAS